MPQQVTFFTPVSNPNAKGCIIEFVAEYTDAMSVIHQKFGTIKLKSNSIDLKVSDVWGDNVDISFSGGVTPGTVNVSNGETSNVTVIFNYKMIE